jgi:uncharacterized protein (TIGR01777 family)
MQSLPLHPDQSPAELEAWLLRPATRQRLQPPWNPQAAVAEMSLEADGTLRVGGDNEAECAFRARRALGDLRRLGSLNPLRVAVAGGSGLVGTQLRLFLRSGGHEVIRLVRGAWSTPDPFVEPVASWEPDRGEIDSSALEGCDVIINLAGAGIADRRWTASYRDEILRSRIQATTLLARTVQRLEPPPVFVSASAVGYYGYHTGDAGPQLDEDSAAGTDFLADVCRQWEDAASAVADVTRLVYVRIGMVVTSLGGALGRMLGPFRLGVGGPIGSGRQMISWIAMDDLLGVLLTAAVNATLRGPVNAVSPHAVTQLEFARTLGSVLSRPAVMPLPATAVRLMFGDMGEAVLLGGQHVVPRRLLDGGFEFYLSRLEEALRFELGSVVAPDQ